MLHESCGPSSPPQGRNTSSRRLVAPNRTFSGHAEGECMHMRIPHTKADMRKFKQLTSTYPPPEVHVRDQHTIIVWKQDRKTVAKKVGIFHASGKLVNSLSGSIASMVRRR